MSDDDEVITVLLSDLLNQLDDHGWGGIFLAIKRRTGHCLVVTSGSGGEVKRALRDALDQIPDEMEKL